MGKISSIIKDLIDFALNRPKIILLVIVVLVVIFGVSSLFTSNDATNGEANRIIVYGMPFNIPEGYTEGQHHSFTNGEYAELDDNAWSIEISVSSDRNFKESKYVKSHFSKTINGKEGTVYTYKTNHTAFVYYEDNYLIVIRDATFDELEKIII